eukprot:scaffold4797_cov152-Skeletonema_marinoi.AAC.20
MEEQSDVRAQLKPPTLEPLADDGQVGGVMHTGDNSAKAIYSNDRLQEGDTYPIDNTFGKFEMALEDAKRTLEKEKMLNLDDQEEDRIDQTTESKGIDEEEFMDIRSNPDPAVFYTITDETTNASRSMKKKKNKRDNDDLLVAAIKSALNENISMSEDDSYTQFSHNASSYYTDADLINHANSTMSSTYSGSYDEDATLAETLLSGSSAYDSQEPSDEKRHSQSRAPTLDEETLFSDYTEYTTMTSSVTSDCQSSVLCTSRPNKKEERTQTRHRGGGTVHSAFSEPTYLENEDDYYDDDDVSCDDTYATRGTVGLVQDIVSCGTYRLCFGDGKKYRPKDDLTNFTVSTKETRRRKGSKATSSTPLTVKERLSIARSKNSLADDAAEATAKKEDSIFLEEEDANAIAETLDNIFWEGDGGLFSDESCNSSEKSGNINDLLDQSPQGNPPTSTEKSLPATSEASIASSKKKMKPYLLSAARSFGKSVSFRKQKSSATQQLPTEIGVDEEQSITGLTKQLPIEIDVDEGQTTTAPPSVDPKMLGVASHEAEANTATVQATEQDLQRDRCTTDEKKSFRQKIRPRSSSRKRSAKQSSIVETPTRPARTEDSNDKKSPKKSSFVEWASPDRTVDVSISSDSTGTDPELSAITANKWKTAIDKVTGKTYFYNKLTKEVTWDAPDDVVEEKRASPLWKAAYDTTTGQTYYYNRQTKAVTWNKPHGFVTPRHSLK